MWTYPLSETWVYGKCICYVKVYAIYSIFDGDRMSRSVFIAAGTAMGLFVSYYTFYPVHREMMVLKAIRRLEEAGRFDEARQIAESMDFKELKVTLLKKKRTEEENNSNPTD